MSDNESALEKELLSGLVVKFYAQEFDTVQNPNKEL